MANPHPHIAYGNKARGKKFFENNGFFQRKGREKEYAREYNSKKRKEIIDFLGGKCAKCGFEDVRALQVDHINGGGMQEIRRYGKQSRHLHRLILNNKLPKKLYQVLCANCNWIKRDINQEYGNKYIKNNW